MSRRNLVIAAAVAALAAALALVLLSAGGADEAAGTTGEASAGVATETASQRAASPSAGARESGERSGGVAPAEPRPQAPEARAAATPATAAAAPAAPSSGAGAEGSGGSNGPASSETESKAVANKEDIRAAILALKGDLKACFEQGLKSNPELDGTVKVAFTLARSPDGGAYAREGEIDDSTLGAPLVEACILSKIQTAKFKDLKGDGEVRVRYPFRLSGDGAAGFGGQ